MKYQVNPLPPTTRINDLIYVEIEADNRTDALRQALKIWGFRSYADASFASCADPDDYVYLVTDDIPSRLETPPDLDQLRSVA